MTTTRATGRVFISHSHQDDELVRDLARRLREAGLEPFVDFVVRAGEGVEKDCTRANPHSGRAILILVYSVVLELRLDDDGAGDGRGI